MTIAEAERRYLSSDWCMAISFSDFLHLLEQKGVEVSYERPT